MTIIFYPVTGKRAQAGQEKRRGTGVKNAGGMVFAWTCIINTTAVCFSSLTEIYRHCAAPAIKWYTKGNDMIYLTIGFLLISAVLLGYSFRQEAGPMQTFYHMAALVFAAFAGVSALIGMLMAAAK